jgi:hypothetical protein
VKTVPVLFFYQIPFALLITTPRSLFETMSALPITKNPKAGKGYNLNNIRVTKFISMKNPGMLIVLYYYEPFAALSGK